VDLIKREIKGNGNVVECLVSTSETVGSIHSAGRGGKQGEIKMVT
jgi:hypothetical protein